MVSPVMGTYLLTLGQPISISIACDFFENFLENSDQQLKAGLFMVDVRVFVKCSLSLGGSSVNPNGKFSVKPDIIAILDG